MLYLSPELEGSEQFIQPWQVSNQFVVTWINETSHWSLFLASSRNWWWKEAQKVALTIPILLKMQSANSSQRNIIGNLLYIYILRVINMLASLRQLWQCTSQGFTFPRNNVTVNSGSCYEWFTLVPERYTVPYCFTTVILGCSSGS